MPLDTSALPLLALRLRVRFDSVVPTPEHAGEMWRGAIKHGLQRQAPDVLAALCEPETLARRQGLQGAPTNQLTPGFVVRVELPPAGEACVDQFVVLTYFGRAGLHALAVMYALLDRAATGVGARKLAFALQELQFHSPGYGWQAMSLPLRAEEILANQWVQPASEAGAAGAVGHVCLSMLFTSRLVLEVQDMRLTGLPTLGLLTQALIERANRLGHVWGSGEVVGSHAQRLMQAAAASAQVLDAGSSHLEQRHMPSARQRTAYPSGGPRGMFVYELPIDACTALTPLLDFGQWLHIGQQTTAGLGHYRLLVQRA